MARKSTPYRLTLHLTPRLYPVGACDVLFHDTAYGLIASGVAGLVPEPDQMLQPGYAVHTFLTQFWSGTAASPTDGKAFGMWLLERLLSEAGLRDFWTGLSGRRQAEARPLRLEIWVPANAPGWLTDLPFELLADEDDFLFHQPGSALIRCIQGHRGSPIQVAARSRIAPVWANPLLLQDSDTPKALPQSVFDAHVRVVGELALKLGLVALPESKHTSPRTLSKYRDDHGQAQILVIVTHGARSGSRLVLHACSSPQYPADLGELLDPKELVLLMRDLGVQVAFLWVCHSARPAAGETGLPVQLLDPGGAQLHAVVAAQAAINAEASAQIAGAIAEELAGPAKGDLEDAINRARVKLAKAGLQWAVPVYYARPLDGQTVTLTVAMTSRTAEAPPST